MNCRLLFFVFLLGLFSSQSIFSQENVLKDMQGLSLKGDMIFELKGYVITVSREKGSLYKKKDIEKIKKNYELKNVTREYKDADIKWQHLVIESTTSVKGVPEAQGFQICYLLPESDDRMMVVLMQSANGRDEAIEDAFMEALFSRELTQYAVDNWTASTIDFAGREIQLGDMCNWVSPQNVHCATFGQMSWSVFDTEEKALINTKILEAMNDNSGKYKVEKEEEVKVVFEGELNYARRITYKIKGSKLLLGGRNQIAVYYITQKVRGKYVSCMLTNYIEVKDNYELPMLLREVMGFVD